MSINDKGNTGTGGALTGSDTATINIAPIVSACTYKTFNNSNQQTNQTEIDSGNGSNAGHATITLTFSGAVTFTGGNPSLTMADGEISRVSITSRRTARAFPTLPTV